MLLYAFHALLSGRQKKTPPYIGSACGLLDGGMRLAQELFINGYLPSHLMRPLHLSTFKLRTKNEKELATERVGQRSSQTNGNLV